MNHSNNGHIKNGQLKYWESETERRAKAFNKGSDARIAGRSLMTNPYPVEGSLTDYWIQGWKDVNNNWGLWARWPVMSIPDVSE